MKLRTLLIVGLLILAGVMIAEIPAETVLAKHSNGTITMGDFNLRMSKIPPMYIGRYQSYEGKVKFLEELITEEVFYQEALASGLENDPEILKKAENQIISTYYTEYQNHLKKTEVKITDEELNEYFLNNLDEFPGLTFEEARTLVENQYRPQVEKEFIAEYDKKLWEKFEMQVLDDVIDSLDFNNAATYEEILDTKYITCNEPSLERTVSYLVELYDGLPNQNKRSFLNAASRLNMVNEMAKMSMYYFEAREAGFDSNPKVLETMPMIKRNLMLREIYNRLVTEKIDVSEPVVREYYENNIEKFSTKPYRKIQAFGYKDEKAAKAARKNVKKAVKKDDKEKLAAALEASVFEYENGEIDHIYKNNIIPKCGKDTLWCEKVWETGYGKSNPKKVSDIFVNAQGNYVFFRILEDHEPVATPFEEERIKIENQMRKDKSREYFEQADTMLREKLQVEIFNDNLVEKLTAEEYFTNAESAQKKRRYKDAIYYYDQIIEYYANGVDDYKAMFMKAFIYSEDLKEADKAMMIFEEFLEKYPQGDLRDSAEFMINELQGNNDILEKMEEEE